MTISDSATAAPASAWALMPDGSSMPARYGVLVCRRVISSATSGSNAHMRTSWPTRDAWLASAVPHAPAPTTEILPMSR
jgi:hypothetical protein